MAYVDLKPISAGMTSQLGAVEPLSRIRTAILRVKAAEIRPRCLRGLGMARSLSD